ncbi:hypothetical protein [uncultured Microbacterium sp.]|uniref:hypothetical protein n=1 Tax=uncultured Microbacterium sp. TaxID=191216 RepID=UPI0028D2A1D2|nr:hypothetical protein [uncultured Microbacterium sp.]
MSASASDDLTPGSDEHWEAVHTGLATDHLIALGQVAYWSARIDTTLPLLAAALIRASNRPRTRKQAEVVGLPFSSIFEKTSVLVAELDAADQVRVLFERDASAIKKTMEDRNHLLHAYWLRGPREPAMAQRTRRGGTTTTPFSAADVERVAVDLAHLSDRVWLISAVADGVLEYQEVMGL